LEDLNIYVDSSSILQLKAIARQAN